MNKTCAHWMINDQAMSVQFNPFSLYRTALLDKTPSLFLGRVYCYSILNVLIHNLFSFES